jgi:protein-disulfide isomerase
MTVRVVYIIAALSLLGLSSCKPAATQKGYDPNAPVAKIGDSSITGKELDEFAKAELRKLENQYEEQKYQIRHQALENMVNKRLVDEKAKKAGKSPEDYVKSEVADKIAAPTDAEIQEFYDKTKASGRQLPPLDQIKEPITNYLKQQKSQGVSQAFYDGLRKEAKVEITLPAYQPPRVTVDAKGPSKGPDNAPITIVEFSDYECPYCSRAETVVQEVLKEYPGKIRLVYRDLPLPMHPHAPKASEAAHCAGDQGKYWEMHAKLFENQHSLDISNLKEYAKGLGLDAGKFDKCLDSGEKAKVVEESRKAGEELGVNGTPAFFINGIMINGAQPVQAFKSIIDSELKGKK